MYPQDSHSPAHHSRPLDYGSPIYGLTPPFQLQLLYSIQNSALRIATGAFCTSPAISLCAETSIPPVHYRRLTLTVKFLTAYSNTPRQPHTTISFTLHQPFTSIITSVLISNSNFKFQALTSFFSATPRWSFSAPIINYTLAQHSKA